MEGIGQAIAGAMVTMFVLGLVAAGVLFLLWVHVLSHIRIGFGGFK